ncbi:hypothetical protein CHY_2122 [Carboxydothermus hydrogenoformans Z-2901]|uniref:Uncharacterized protein n=1 Tax=Carboxydothermus hydrogenoformans (strain ATCC BAA-161 / DSM 6008 / Z-2901) TaxID=246194 RepID=Q3AA98_CARHZ|nr:hypothetical protein CHY_2122 [Carboxydothermus hydrogenoformans Z-2901]
MLWFLHISGSLVSKAPKMSFTKNHYEMYWKNKDETNVKNAEWIQLTKTKNGIT